MQRRYVDDTFRPSVGRWRCRCVIIGLLLLCSPLTKGLPGHASASKDSSLQVGIQYLSDMLVLCSGEKRRVRDPGGTDKNVNFTL